MRVLILSANTGGGHNSTAGALAEQFDKLKVSFEIADALSLISEKASIFISWGHTYVYRNLPWLFGKAYRYEELHTPKFIYNQCAKGADALHEKLLGGNYDVIICVHVFACMMMTEVKKRYGLTIPNYFVATDYTCSPGVSELLADGYFVPHRMLFSEFVRANLPADKLFATGIPIRSAFQKEGEKLSARKKLGLPEEGNIVLLSCGSIGCGKLEKKALKMLKMLPWNTTLVVLCGTNEKAYEQLAPYQSGALVAVGFVENIAEYMNAADVYLTKPGGLMTTEAIARRLPMVFINAVPGCETRNFRFLMKHGVAIGSLHWKQSIRMTIDLLENQEAQEKIKSAMSSFTPVNSAELICKYVMKKQ